MTTINHRTTNHGKVRPRVAFLNETPFLLGTKAREAASLPTNAIDCINHRDRDDGFTASFVHQMSNFIVVAVDLFATPDARL